MIACAQIFAQLTVNFVLNWVKQIRYLGVFCNSEHTLSAVISISLNTPLTEQQTLILGKPRRCFASIN
jgi:hypothetical protein